VDKTLSSKLCVPCKICRPFVEAKCVANRAIAIGVKNLCDQILCLKGETNEFHKLQCIQGDCSTCGVLTLPVCPCEVDVNAEVTVPWQQFEKNMLYISSINKPFLMC
jgi:hypothetical protein